VRKFNLEPDQELFHDYIKLYLAIPETCESAAITSNNDVVNVFSELKCNTRDILNSTKCVYLHLLESIISPEKNSLDGQMNYTETARL